MPLDPPKPPQSPSLLSDLERDRGKAELYRPATMLRTTEWGLLTFASLVAAFAFPPYFISVLWLAFFNAGGLLWVTHMSEQGRRRLKEFEREFSQGHGLEEQGKIREAAAFYSQLAPKYQEFPKIAEIAVRRIEFLKSRHPQSFQAPSTRPGPSRGAKIQKKKKKRP